MPQDLIGCRKRRKLKALIPRVVVFVNDPSSAERRIDFAVFFIVLWSYGRKICLNMCHGNSENSYGCSYLLRICFIYGTNVSVSQSWISLQVVDREQCVECALWFTNKRVQIQQILSMLKLFSFESLLLWTGFSSGGSLRKKPQSPTVKYYSWTKNIALLFNEFFVGIIKR